MEGRTDPKYCFGSKDIIYVKDKCKLKHKETGIWVDFKNDGTESEENLKRFEEALRELDFYVMRKYIDDM